MKMYQKVQKAPELVITSTKFDISDIVEQVKPSKVKTPYMCFVTEKFATNTGDKSDLA